MAVERRLVYQLLMRSGGDDTATIEKEDTVGPDHRCQPVRDDDRSAVLHQRLQRRLNRSLGPRVKRACRLVEKKQPRVTQDRARNRDPLALPAGQADALLADSRVIALPERGDEAVRLGLPRCRDDVRLAGIGPPESDVVADACREQRRILRHQPDEAADVGQREIAKILSAKPHGTRRRVVESQQQVEQGRFSGPARADERHPFAAFHH